MYTTNLRAYMHGNHGIVFQKLPWANDTASDVRLDGYDIERVVEGLFNSHLDTRLVIVAFVLIVRSPLSLGICIGTRVEFVVE